MRRAFIVVSLLLGACGGGDDADPGSLIAVSVDSQVGVLLDEVPAANRDAAAAEIIAEPQSFWLERAKQQLRLTGERLVFRGSYYEPAGSKQSLPLPPEEDWNITLDTAGPSRQTVDGHDLVMVHYTLASTLLSDLDSVGRSEPALVPTGGTWDEMFTFPIDPTLLLQRTGYACMNEDQYPSNSVDAENAGLFYDDTCDVETQDQPSCHYTLPEPTVSCVDAVTNVIGHVDSDVHFERLPWSDSMAETVRSGEVTHTDGPDMKVLTSGLEVNRIVWRYFQPDDCAIADGCIGAPGWRRFVTFDSHDQNVGAKPLEIGNVDYFASGENTELASHGVYEYSQCHMHWHFRFYGDFSYSGLAGNAMHKNGFCLESTDRLSNNETSPLSTVYSVCDHQGVDAGWGDEYQAGLTCNWIDLTDLDTSNAASTGTLEFHSNPDGFLCEGTPVLDSSGNQVWEPTNFTTSDGMPVERPACNQFPDAADNDIGDVNLTVPQGVGGMVTSACDAQSFGPNRNCDFSVDADMQSCNPGSTVTLSCSVADATKPQVLRTCEGSRALNAGMECSQREALSNTVIDGSNVQVSFTCPAARDQVETGGKYSLYTAPVFDATGAVSAVTCQ